MAAKDISGFGAMLDGPQPHAANDVAAGVNDAPVAGEDARALGVVGEDARLGREARAAPFRRDEEVHRGGDAAIDVRGDDDLARVVGEVAEGGPRGDVEERLR